MIFAKLFNTQLLTGNAISSASSANEDEDVNMRHGLNQNKRAVKRRPGLA